MKIASTSISLKASGLFLLAFFLFSALFGQEIMSIKSLNSPYDEQNPVFSPNGELYFTIGFHPDNAGGPTDLGDIWVSIIDSKGNWLKPQRVPDLSTSGNDVLIGFSDALTALVYHSGQNGKRQGIHQYSRFGNSWNYRSPLEMGNFKNNGTHFSGRLSLDGNLIVMSMSSFGSFGNEDIYVSFKQSELTWSSPLNLGSQINTFAQEFTPYLSDDLQTIYFSSNSKDNRRGKDIYYSQRSGSAWDNWTVPLPVKNTNTQGSEMSYFRVPGKEGNAIFTSTQNSEGFGDFFLITFQPIQPLLAQSELFKQDTSTFKPVKTEEAVLSAKGDDQKIDAETSKVLIPENVIDSTQNQKVSNPEKLIEIPVSSKPIPQKKSFVVLDALTKASIDYEMEIGNGRGIKKVVKTQEQGWIELEDTQWVNISISSKGYVPKFFDKMVFLELEGKEVLLTPAVAGAAIILENIQFNRGTADFADAKTLQVLDDLVVFLKENPGIKIRLEGHTDNAGDPSLNKDLSMKRASKIRGYMTINGIEFERVRISGWGGTRPIADNSTEDGKNKNRRVEMVIES